MTVHKPWYNSGCDADAGIHHVKAGDTISGPGYVADSALADDAVQTDGVLVADGGWTAPADTVFDDCTLSSSPIELPTITAPRGGIDFTPPTAAEQRASDALHSFVNRAVEQALRIRHETVERAALTAYTYGWDLHIYEPPQPTLRHDDLSLHRQRFIGIEFTTRTEHSRPFPTIHEHRDDIGWTDWWEDE